MSHPYMYDEHGNLLPWYKLAVNPIPTWTEQFEEDFRKRWNEHNKKLESIIWGTDPGKGVQLSDTMRKYVKEQFDKLKQQYMTTLNSNDPALVEVIADVINATLSQPLSEEGLKFAVQNRLIPLLERKGICFCTSTIPAAKERDNSNLCAQLAPGQSTGEAYAKTVIKPFLMIDINAVKGKDFTVEEILQIFAQTGSINIIRKKKNLTWGQAMEWLKEGRKVARIGWNGNGMFVYYVPPASYPSLTDVARKEFGENVQYEGYFALRNVKGTVNTWVPSVSDNLAEDWFVA